MREATCRTKKAASEEEGGTAKSMTAIFTVLLLFYALKTNTKKISAATGWHEFLLTTD